MNTEGLTSYDIEGMESLSTRSSGYLLAIDADYFSSEFVGTFVQTCPAGGPLSGRRESEERLFGREGEDKGFGAFVSMPRTEFEFGESISNEGEKVVNVRCFMLIRCHGGPRF